MFRPHDEIEDMVAELRLRDIRSHEGTQARAWEELAYQLRPPVGPGHVETRKTRAPDAGVEWYEVYADGHVEGFQAKFNETLADALGGMRESVEAVCKKRSKLTKLTFIVPYDFTDTGEATLKSDQDRWDDAVARWKTDFLQAAGIEFTTIRAGDILASLSLKEHAGRREYWFGDLDLTEVWFAQRFSEAVKVAGERYTPDADVPSQVNAVGAAVAGTAGFVDEVRAATTLATSACRRDTGMWAEKAGEVTGLIAALETAVLTGADAESDGAVVLNQSLNLAHIQALSEALAQIANLRLRQVKSFERRNLRSARDRLTALRRTVGGVAAAAYTQRQMAVIGPAGQGKTHALMRIVHEHLNSGAPALAVLGQRLSDQNWWQATAAALGGVTASSDEFFQALDSLAAASNTRALLVFDALNESQAPARWQTELPALIALVEQYTHLALVVSFRTDYRDFIGAPEGLLIVTHPGLAGHEGQGLAAYCDLYQVTVPTQGLYEPAFSSPLFLRMYCAVMAEEGTWSAGAPTRSSLFQRYARVRSKKVVEKLGLSPTTSVVDDAIEIVATHMLANAGRAVPRKPLEEKVDALARGRTWPDTLFQQMASEGLIELRPTFDGTEAVAFPFQAYSEHLLADRLLDAVSADSSVWWRQLLPIPRQRARRSVLRRRASAATWAWRALAVLLPERHGIELVDVISGDQEEYLLQEATRDSLKDRRTDSFGERALELLEVELGRNPDEDVQGIDTVLSLAPREAHPGNADWLHRRLIGLPMAERDTMWTIATFKVREESPAYRRLTEWSHGMAGRASDAEMRLAGLTLMWLFTSSSRFLRDHATKSLASLLSKRLTILPAIVRAARDVDDPYVQERVLTCAYGALLVSGDSDLPGARAFLSEVQDWAGAGLPIDVLARDSVRGIGAWCVERGLLSPTEQGLFEPPYGSDPPAEPPTKEDLESAHGWLRDEKSGVDEWRAQSILMSCLDWMGDFNKYVVKGDAEHFSFRPLTGPKPTERDQGESLDQVEADWAGRWIADQAISMGWTAERFGRFEQTAVRGGDRDAHKAERIGKKYQWIAHHELLARLADNFHPSHELWGRAHDKYEGPWVFYGRDIDPTLPPSNDDGESSICEIARDDAATWTLLQPPAMDEPATPEDWIARVDDLPSADAMFEATDPDGRRWVAIQRYVSFNRDNAQITGMSKRERDVFFLTFSWLTPRGQGEQLYDLINQVSLSGRWMDDASRTHNQYLGEQKGSPIVEAAVAEPGHHRGRLQGAGIEARPAVEQYLWEGNGFDCSIDDSVNLYAPTVELLGDAKWVGHRAEWEQDGHVVARFIEVDDGEGVQDVLLADPEWLNGRLAALGCDLVIGTLSERHAQSTDSDSHRNIALSYVWYVALLRAGTPDLKFGPGIKLTNSHDDELVEDAVPDGAQPPIELLTELGYLNPETD